MSEPVVEADTPLETQGADDPFGQCDAVTFVIDGLGGPRASVSISLAGVGVQPVRVGGFDFPVRREYSGAVSVGTVYSLVERAEFGKRVEGSDSILTADSLRSGVHQTVFFSYIFGGPKTRDSNWVGGSMGFDLARPGENAFVGLTYAASSVFLVQLGVHFSQVSVTPPDFGFERGAVVNNIALPTRDDWRGNGYLGITIDALAAAAAFKRFLSFEPDSGS